MSPLSLTADIIRHILTVRAGLPTSHIHCGPRPVRAAIRSTDNVDVRARALHRALDLIQNEVLNGDAVGRRFAGVVVVLLHDNAVVGDIGQGDLLVGDVADRASIPVDGLDADSYIALGCHSHQNNGLTILGTLNLRVVKRDILHGVIITTPHRAN